MLWFGSGSVPAILTALSICFFPIVVNIATGLATTEPELEDVLKALGASKFDILWNVGLPRTMPFFFASLKVAVSYAFVGAVLSETVASNSGIGNVLMTASSNFNVPLVFAALFVLAALGVALYVDVLADRGARHRLGHPQGQRRSRPEHESTSPAIQPSRGGHHVNKSKRRAVGSRLCSPSAASAEDTTIKFKLGWTTQGSDAAFFYAKDNGFFQRGGPQRRDRQGQRLRCDRDAYHVGRL